MKELRFLTRGIFFLFCDIAAAIVYTFAGWIVFSNLIKRIKLNFHCLVISNIYLIDI